MNRRKLSGFALFLLLASTAFGQGRGGRGGGRGDFPAPPRDWTRDLQMKIMQPFTLASVGDLIIIRPASNFQDAGLQAALKIIRDSDVGFGNFESLIRDEANFTGPLGGSMVGTKEVAGDLKSMGFKMVNRAGNHLFDSNQEGMYATMDLLDRAGVVYAGAGRDLEDARAAHFLETPKGRVGLVGMYSDVAGGGGGARLSASYRTGNTGGKPGLNPLNLTRSIAVTPDQFAAMKKISDSVYSHRTEYSNPVGPPADRNGELEMFGTMYKIGEKPGSLEYTMNVGDLRDNLRSIKNGKEFSDFMIATIHAHQGDTVLQQFLFEDHTPEFLVNLAHNAIDNGADAFVGHGPHIIRGIEIYKGKPIFYDLGEFFREWDWSCDCDNPSTPLTTAERTVTGLNNRGVMEPVNCESLIALSRYDKGKLQEVRVYPIWARQDGPISRRGIPEMAPPEIAQRILARLQTLSKPFKTTIAVENNVSLDRIIAHHQQAVEIYRDHPISIHMVAGLLNHTEFEQTVRLAADGTVRIRCCAGNAPERADALAALRNASAVVLDLTAIATLSLLDALDDLAKFQTPFLVSELTISEMKQDVRKHIGDKPHSVLGREGYRYVCVEATPEAVRSEREHLESVIEKIRARCTVVGCPEFASVPPDKRASLIKAVGEHGAQTMVLASAPGRVLWTDDYVRRSLNGSDRAG